MKGSRMLFSQAIPPQPSHAPGGIPKAGLTQGSVLLLCTLSCIYVELAVYAHHTPGKSGPTNSYVISKPEEMCRHTHTPGIPVLLMLTMDKKERV